MILLLTTFGVSVASALLPLVNIELYMASVGAVGSGEAVSLAIVAGAGQTVGKVFWYEVARRGVETDWAQKKLSAPKVKASYERWVGAMQGRPWFGGAVLFAAALGGIPPLLVMAAVAGALKMPYWVFLPTIFVGRTLRFWLVLVGVDFLFG
jgi:membrane protein YqaA with SNARE-associated domain